MKRKWNHPAEPESSRTHWRSLGELEKTEEFQGWLEREFPQGAAELEMDETSRRNFVKLMGASTALAGFGVSCSRPVQHLVPYNEHVEWIIPGKALYYSSAKPRLGGIGCDPLVVTTHEGRPTKVDGNRLHPASNGGSSAYTQATALEMYDQDRSRGVLEGGKESALAAFEVSFLQPFREAKSGEKVALLVSESTSPTRNRLLEEVARAYPGLKMFQYEALRPDGARAASDELYGKGSVPVVELSSAKRVLSLDCDFLGLDPVGEDSLGEFSATRNPDLGGKMGRLYVAESAFSLTGGQADHRYRIASSQVFPLAALVAAKLGEKLGDSTLTAAAKVVTSGVVSSIYRSDWIDECVADLAENKGSAVVLAGSRHSKEVHLLTAAINNALGAYGKQIAIVDHKLPELGGINELAAAIKGGQIDRLFVMNEGDVAFDAPAELGMSELLSDVGEIIHLGYRVNQTAKLADWHINGTHYLESWGDHYSASGVYSVQQPMIDPLWGGVSEIVFLQSLLKGGASEELALAEVKKTFGSLGAGNWTNVLRDGFLADTVLPKKNFSGKVSIKGGSVKIADLPYSESLEVVLATSSATYDGRYANNGWLQEAPDPITKLTWDNAALMSFSTAADLDLDDGDLVELSIGERRVKAPVLRSPGHADFAITLPVGYYGSLADDTVSQGVGFNAYPLMTSSSRYVVTGVALRKTAGKHQLALTAEHYSMEGRAIAREGTVEMYDQDKHFAEHQGMDHHIPENVSLYKGPDYDKAENPGDPVIGVLNGHEFRIDPLHQWAMTVDLNTCIGCNACVIACQSENNIPIVGKDQVLGGREMHWIRMDRYFTSPTDDKTVGEQGLDFKKAEEYKQGKYGEPGRRVVDDDQIEMIPQPVACQQCESAPCETVCPVNATVHTSDGLNAMTYNRCIGTRYCANNCPYKARRFNYYDYNKRPIEKIEVAGIEAEGIKFGPLAPANGNATTTQRLQKNPNVTVRMRGVIEKCTYCVQRISAAKIAAKAAARDSADIQVPANSFTVACQDACGAEAIQFGNLKHPKDKINSKTGKKNPRNYDLLKYIGTMPRTSYLARIKNPNPNMPGANQVGTVTSKMH
ncbi:TAT-variant-translocated molybdopterin oxidoreductase [Verrucomicrobiales bacterium]|nr:TAT-variant-translocated molybdopterin oxidoreductase [Verrucomicrobiales bacterium]